MGDEAPWVPGGGGEVVCVCVKIGIKLLGKGRDPHNITESFFLKKSK